ncbi:DUF438 domain-containing protein [Brachyspira pilosicoli]|uniref:DUF438 domain-containing protein n=1 Tax=Brachyspira pilosicoli TaxID=52584 RepID=A0A5C8EHU8_BRAPL|nr:DUF438 domain-containing protein [Brachyspira pilosicoli]TXJ37306.1 DUF438 domain-containing protein [Brachyspira pilosicoli]
MNKFININESVYNICKNHSEIKDILYDLGFEAIKNPIMFNTIARKISIKKALEIKKVSEDKLIEKFRENGFDIANRNSILKDLIVRLHNNENIESIKKEFDTKLNKVSAVEVHNAMHELIKEGMDIDEAKEYFYNRSLILKDAIENSEDDMIYFKNTNREIKKLLRNILENKDRNIFEKLYRKVKTHYTKKESLIFTALKKHNNDEPSKVMSKVDKDITEYMDYIKNNNLDDNSFFTEMYKLCNNINDMIFKEENILIPLAVSVLSEEELKNIKENYIK